MSSNRTLLAQYASKRRSDLGLSHAEVATRGGPSSTTLTNIELAQGSRPSPGSLKRLDAALRWKDGSAWRILTTGEPPEEEPVLSSAETSKALRAKWASQYTPQGALRDVNDLVDLAHQVIYFLYQAEMFGASLARLREMAVTITAVLAETGIYQEALDNPYGRRQALRIFADAMKFIELIDRRTDEEGGDVNVDQGDDRRNGGDDPPNMNEGAQPPSDKRAGESQSDDKPRKRLPRDGVEDQSMESAEGRGAGSGHRGRQGSKGGDGAGDRP